jgi:hypothetical protein
MQQVSRAKRLVASLAVGAAVAALAALGSGALLAEDTPAAPAAGSGVTFVNDSKHAINLFARYGSDEACTSRPKQMELNVAAGSSSTVDSGATKVCFCLDLPDRNNCPTGWIEVKPGGKRVFR